MVAVYNEETDTYTLPSDEKPKRHRRSKEEMEAARAAGEVQDKAPSGRGRKASLKGLITDLVGTVNVLLWSAPWTREDALSEDETTLLVEGIDKAQQVDERLRKALQAGSKVSGYGALIYAATLITLPRLVRHGVIPAPHPPKQEVHEQERPMETNGYAERDYSPFGPSVATR